MKQNELSKKEQYDLEKQKKDKMNHGQSQVKNRSSYAKRMVFIAVILGGLGYLVWIIATAPKLPESAIITRSGLHYHPQLEIYIKGAKRDIPANIGIGAVHNPIHTHKNDGILHLEFQGIVKKSDLRLANFFEVWGKEFNSECIFDYCNGPDGTVRMFVNGEPNTEFGDYVMRQSDKIEIRYE